DDGAGWIDRHHANAGRHVGDVEPPERGLAIDRRLLGFGQRLFRYQDVLLAAADAEAPAAPDRGVGGAAAHGTLMSAVAAGDGRGDGRADGVVGGGAP